MTQPEAGWGAYQPFPTDLEGSRGGEGACPNTHGQVKARALRLWAPVLRTRTAPAPAGGLPFIAPAHMPGAQHPHLVSGSQPASYSPFPAGTALCYSVFTSASVTPLLRAF